MIPRSLPELLAPQDARKFLQNTWGTSFAHFHGARGKFAGLMPWSVLNSILEQHDLHHPRLRLYRRGAELDPSRFRSDDGVLIPELKEELSAGATMIIGAVEQYYRPLRNLIANLEQVFRLPVQANLYVALQKDVGFDLHWDPQDVLIVQVSGRKQWKIYAPTREFPLLEKIPRPAPKVRPIWNRILEEGEALHIPRGFWHVAIPVDEPSLHLTITVRPRIGYDLIRWLADELITQSQMRMNAPLFEKKTVQQRWSRMIKETILHACNHNVLDQYFAAVDAARTPRPRLELPSLPSLRSVKIDMDRPIRLATPRSLHFVSSSNGVVQFKCCGHLWTTSAGVVPSLKRLVDGKSHTLRELLRGKNGSTAMTARLLIQAMALRGVIVPSDPE